MSDLDSYIEERKRTDKGFAEGFDEGYEQFKIGEILRQAREAAGLTQEELAIRVHTKKTAISRIENHAEDIKYFDSEACCKGVGQTSPDQSGMTSGEFPDRSHKGSPRRARTGKGFPLERDGGPLGCRPVI